MTSQANSHLHCRDSDSSPKSARPILRALVAEDNELNQCLVGRLLAKYGYDSVIVDNGQQVLDALSRERFDFVLMDIQMPVMDGVQATQAIREAEQGTELHVPIIALTANAIVGDRERFLAAGADGYVSKPIDPRRLLAEIESLTEVMKAGEEMEGRPSPAEVFNVEETLERFDGDTEFLAEVAAQFRQDAAELLGSVDAALSSGDGSGLRSAAHALKGAASNFGARMLEELGQTVEDLGAAGDLEQARPLAEQLCERVAQLNRALDDFCASHTA